MRRFIAFALWAYVGWYLTSMIAAAAGLPPELGPIGGAAVGAFAIVDWRGRMRSPHRGAAITPAAERQRTS